MNTTLLTERLQLITLLDPVFVSLPTPLIERMLTVPSNYVDGGKMKLFSSWRLLLFTILFFLFSFSFLPVLGGSSDLFASRTGKYFDPISVYESAVELVLSFVFIPERVERLLIQRSPTLKETISNFSMFVIEELTQKYICSPQQDPKNLFLFETICIQSVLINKYLQIIVSPHLYSVYSIGIFTNLLNSIKSTLVLNQLVCGWE
jgi:hypothetical protein